jgi:dolichyl-phosphate-mannose--protein O-mannosyl transferase
VRCAARRNSRPPVRIGFHDSPFVFAHALTFWHFLQVTSSVVCQGRPQRVLLPHTGTVLSSAVTVRWTGPLAEKRCVFIVYMSLQTKCRRVNT